VDPDQASLDILLKPATAAKTFWIFYAGQDLVIVKLFSRICEV
jgi:hypothetical protein